MENRGKRLPVRRRRSSDKDKDNPAGPVPDEDEEARLLPTEELEFEDNIEARPAILKQRSGIFAKLRGPQPPQIQNIKTLFPSIEAIPQNLLDRAIPKREHRIVALALFVSLWLLFFIGFLLFQLPIKDSNGKHVINLDCVDTLWKPKNGCGIDGIDCRPFQNTSFAFRCPAECASVKVLNPRAVGPQDINYRPLIVGDEVYRGDSFLCGAAIHAGIISNSKGGCGRVNYVGRHESFQSVERHGLESISFDSYFPLSFSLESDKNFRCPSDPRRGLIFVTLFFTSILTAISTSPAIFFPIFVMMTALVSFGSDPPTASFRNVTVLPDHISMFAKRLLPGLFCAVIIYRTSVKHTLSGLTAQVEKTVLWLGGFFFGALSNYTFDWIPISRLTAHDLEQQPGAKLALAIILIMLVLIIAGQAYFFWLEGRLLRSLSLYGLFIGGILICLTIPGVSLRLHHYILALLLLPGTSLQTRPSLLYQGILLGIFVNGIARWDFDSVLQTTDALRGDGKFESAVPKLLEPAISFTEKSLVAVFSWTQSPPGVVGISALVNDVERGRWFFNDRVDDEAQNFEWTRSKEMRLDEYVRFAYVKDGRALDYTKAGTLLGNGTWVAPQQETSTLFKRL